MKSKIYFLLMVLVVFGGSLSAQETKIEIPSFNDKYSQYVKQLEAGDSSIDYADFRNSFLESEQYGLKSTNYDDLKKKVYAAVKAKKYEQIVDLTKSMLSIDYTSMFAHFYLQKTYGILGDTVNQKKYHDIEFGLLNSIIKSGDGKTCETGWHVTQIEEEYFIINMMNADLIMQSTTSAGKNNCDAMMVKEGSGKKTLYFEINKIFEMEMKMFGKN